MSLLFLCDLLDFIKRASYNLISDKIWKFGKKSVFLPARDYWRKK